MWAEDIVDGEVVVGTVPTKRARKASQPAAAAAPAPAARQKWHGRHRTCTVPGCQKLRQMFGLCARHGGRRCAIEKCVKTAQFKIAMKSAKEWKCCKHGAKRTSRRR